MKILYKFIFFICICSAAYSQQTGWVWQNPLPQGNGLTSSSIINPGVGYAIGDWGAFLKTTNNGSNWFYIKNNLEKQFNAVFFVNENTGYANDHP